MNKTKVLELFKNRNVFKVFNKVFDWARIRSKLRKSRKVQFSDLELMLHHFLA